MPFCIRYTGTEGMTCVHMQAHCQALQKLDWSHVPLETLPEQLHHQAIIANLSESDCNHSAKSEISGESDPTI